MSKIHCYYRISDHSYHKPKLPGTDKELCFLRFLLGFPDSEITIIADRINQSQSMLETRGRGEIIQTDLGNAGSLRYALNLAIDQCDDDTIAYFAEDDYLYKNGAIDVLREGLSLADYVTLYDHPDKYTSQYDFGETSKVRKTKSTHWRYTLSTCMTFGVRASTLRHDMYYWNEQTEDEHPNDHQVFCDLNAAHRSLAVCIPGWSCHTDLTFSGVANVLLMEPWAIDQAIDWLVYTTSLVKDEMFQNMREGVLKAYYADSWQKLQMFDALNKVAANTNTQD